jgi:hypothetical protein
VVLEPGEPGHAEFGVNVGDDLAHPAAFAAPAADVQDPEPGNRLALHAAELCADHLVAGTHGQDHRAGAGRGGEPAVGAQPPRGEDLRQVLAPAHQVDVAAAGYRLVRVYADGLGVDAAQPGPALEHEQVASVPVGAEQVRVDPDQPQAARRRAVPRAGHWARPRAVRICWNAV